MKKPYWYIDLKCRNLERSNKYCELTKMRNNLLVATAVVLHRSSPEWHAQDQARFEKAIVNHRGKPLTASERENMHRTQIVASADVNEKHFQEAADAYENVLQQSPWWAAGHFNRALILGELKDYTEAIAEMKRCLALVPRASNVRAAHDKIYVWESKNKAAGGQ